MTAETQHSNKESLIEVRTLGIGIAKEMRDFGVERANRMGLSGFFVVCNSLGLQLCSETVGPNASIGTVEVALAKMRTVLNSRRSSSVQRARMNETGATREDYADRIGSLFGGGVAVFADELRREFVGGVAFSGGLQEQDEEICRTAIEALGLFTDLPQKDRIPTTS